MVSTPLGGSSDNESHGVSLDELYSILDNERRRVTLSYLAAADGPVTIDEVVDRASGDGEREKAAIELHHVHLPKMEAAGVIEYDDETVTLVAGEEVSEHFLDLGA